MLPVVIVSAFAAFLLKLLLATARALRLAGQLHQQSKEYLWLRIFCRWLILDDCEGGSRMKTLVNGDLGNYSIRVAGMAL